MSADGHRLVLFDVDGTLLSAGRAARDSIVEVLREVYGTDGAVDGFDFSGKTDPQIVCELLTESVPRDRLEELLPDALALYLMRLEQNLARERNVRPKPGIPDLLSRLAREPRVTLALLTGNLERGARLKLEPPGFNPYFSFGAFGSDSRDRYELPEVAVARARTATGRDFPGDRIVIVGDSIHDVRCGRPLGVRTVAVASGKTPLERLAEEKPAALFSDFSDVGAALEAILA
jgi:phosphoglycolate phosphatase-like HAD superfamily hydrolase